MTFPSSMVYTPQNGGFAMKGSIICATRGCGAARSGITCPKCGQPTCYIAIYWKGRHYTYRRDERGHVLVDYNKASAILSKIRLAMDEGTFSPLDYTQSSVKERKFENKLYKWLDEKAQEVKANELSPETCRSYNGYINNYFLPHFKGWDIQSITDEKIEEFKDSLRRLPGIKSRRNIMNALHCFFVWLKRKKAIKEVPAWPIIKGNNARERTAIDYDTQIFGLANIPEKHRDPIEFGFETGLRPGETCALQAGDFDFPNNRVLIQRAWSNGVLKRPKNGEGKWITLSTRARALALKNAFGKLPGAFLFINPDTGRNYMRRQLRDIWAKYSKVPVSHYEASRHSFCTQILQAADANIFDAQELMRHKDIRSTRHYYHATTKKLTDIVNRRGRVHPLQNENKTGKIGL